MHTNFAIILLLLHVFRADVNARETWDFIELNTIKEDVPDNNTFPDDFLFGIATIAPNYEGAWNVSDKGQSILDYMLHENPRLSLDGNNADIGNDFYHKYKEDLRLARNIGSQLFRFSFSWTRILPKGFINYVSKDGVQFYRDLLDEIIANGMIPFGSMFEFDLPYDLQKMGGVSNPLFIDWFEQYARFLFATFGDKIKLWSTFSSPSVHCYGGASNIFVPALNLSGFADYLCGHHALLAHAKVYHLYDREFRASQNGKVGYINSFQWARPLDPSSETDLNATEDDYIWSSKWLLDPILSSTGDYPSVMKKRIADNSRKQGFSTSRLPSFTEEQIHDIRGTADFIGLNYFTFELMRQLQDDDIDKVYSFQQDMNVYAPVEFQTQTEPSMLSQIIRRINEDYNYPTIYITENGYPDSNLEDVDKVSYLQGHLAEVLKAIQSGADIRGYMYWTLLDCYEWLYGYMSKYGLFQVDFADPNLTRTPRMSARFIERVYKTRRLDVEY